MDWKTIDQKLTKDFIFKNQTELAEAVLILARHSDANNHHADMEIHFNKLHISITTHDKGGLTEKDYLLADAIDRLFDYPNV